MNNVKKNNEQLTSYFEADRLLVALDCIIFGFNKSKLEVLLAKRDSAPIKGDWSLVGGFIKNQETLHGATGRVLQPLTGLKGVCLEQLQAFSNNRHDTLESTISIVYYSLINWDKHGKNLFFPFKTRWFCLSEIPKLAFHHGEMVEMASQRLRHKASKQPIGFELLPEKFTMPQLQTLYEAIYDTSFDKRNFSKKILSNGFLVKLNEKQKGFSKKGAYYYKFDKERYDNFKPTKGFSLI